MIYLFGAWIALSLPAAFVIGAILRWCDGE